MGMFQKSLPVSHWVLLITRLFVSTMSSKKHSGRSGLDKKVSRTWRLTTNRHLDLSHETPCATSVASLLMV